MRSQAVLYLILGGVLCACRGNKAEIPVIPPTTSPLTKEGIGFGVINVSYTHVMVEPENGSASPGYLRRGSLVQIIERRIIKKGAVAESWVLVAGNFQGWLREALVDIYDNEGQAQTAAEAMSR